MNENLRKILSRINAKKSSIEELEYELSLIEKAFVDETVKLADDDTHNLLFGLSLTRENMSSKEALSYIGGIIKAKVSADAKLKSITYFGGFYFFELAMPIGEIELRVPDYKSCGGSGLEFAYYVVSSGYQADAKDHSFCITAGTYGELADKLREELCDNKKGKKEKCEKKAKSA